LIRRLIDAIRTHSPTERVLPNCSVDCHGFLLRHGVYTVLDVPSADATLANRINPRGDIIGRYIDSSARVHGFLLHGG